MTLTNSEKIILIFCFLFIVYVTLHLNRVESFDDPLIDRIKNDLLLVDPRVSELTFRASNESFTEDKKYVFLCLKDKNGNYYDYNMLMYVSLHELAHAFSESIDEEHTSSEFKNNFKILLDKAYKLGLYDPNKPLNYDYCPRNK
jgi:hypothetical protein